MNIVSNHSQRKTSSLNLKLQVYDLSTPKQWTTRFDPQKYILQQASITWQGNEDDYTTNEDDHKRNWGNNLLL
jgi:hypothetical protein